MVKRIAAIATLGIALQCGYPAKAALPTVRALPSSLAVRIVQAALAACAKQGFHVAVALVDPAGTLRTLIVDDGVRTLDIDAARRKALTASALDAPTLRIASQVEATPAYGALLLRLNPELLLIGGGLPIRVEGDILGAIGVGGAPGGDKDQACAQAGLDSVGAELH